jgi:hypothetical protein
MQSKINSVLAYSMMLFQSQDLPGAQPLNSTKGGGGTVLRYPPLSPTFSSSFIYYIASLQSVDRQRIDTPVVPSCRFRRVLGSVALVGNMSHFWLREIDNISKKG